jgi:uncharacterized protein (DUF305 family)
MSKLVLIASGVFLALSTASAAEPAPDTATAKYEVRFMTNMIDHHTMAIRMGEVCLVNAIHDELRALCQNIITAQMQERAMMQSWLQQWYGISYTPEMNPGMMNQIEKLSRLNGADFEIEFMKSMIRHHYQAVIEGAQCMERAYHQELKTLCENIVQAQTQEIQLMRTWLCQWYSICNWGPKGATK